MGYLIQQMWLCLLLAAGIGLIIGWWLKGISSRNKLKQLEADWQQKLESAREAPVLNNDIAPHDASNDETVIAAPTVSKADKTSYPIEEIEGIGPGYGKKLREINISTTQQLLDQCCDMEGQIKIAEYIGIEDFVVQKWASMCDLMRVGGIEGQIAELIAYSGIDSIQHLGQQSTHVLHQKLEQINQEQKRVPYVPDTHAVDLMIKQAQGLEAVIKDE